MVTSNKRNYSSIAVFVLCGAVRLSHTLFGLYVRKFPPVAWGIFEDLKLLLIQFKLDDCWLVWTSSPYCNKQNVNLD
jgi:hypothetical protein